MESSKHYSDKALAPFIGRQLEIASDLLAITEPGEVVKLVYDIWIEPVARCVENEVKDAMREAYLAGFQAAIDQIHMPQDIPVNAYSRQQTRVIIRTLRDYPDELKLTHSNIR